MSEFTGKKVKIVIVTPERAVLDDAVDFVALPMFDGELGVLPGRAPLIGRLGIGELRIRRGDKIESFFIDGGFAQVRAEAVTVLTPSAAKAVEIKADKAQQSLESAASMPNVSALERELKTRTELRARAQLRIVQKSSRGNEH
jgi:F-type H+-transporting ATPase subunit epsilon